MRILTFKRILGLGAIYGVVRYAQKQGVTFDNVGDKLRELVDRMVGAALPASQAHTSAMDMGSSSMSGSKSESSRTGSPYANGLSHTGFNSGSNTPR